MIFHGALIFVVICHRFLVIIFVVCSQNCFSIESWLFWSEAFCKTVLWPFFPWNLSGFVNAEWVFKESSMFLEHIIVFFIRNIYFLNSS